MRQAATLLTLAALAAAADVSLTCGDRVQEAHAREANTPFGYAVEDWQMGVWAAVALAAGGVGWGWAADPRRAAPVRAAGRGGTVGAVSGGLALGLARPLGRTVAGVGEPLDRYGLEVRLLVGAILGGVAGTAVGGGLGLVRRNPERE